MGHSLLKPSGELEESHLVSFNPSLAGEEEPGPQEERQKCGSFPPRTACPGQHPLNGRKGKAEGEAPQGASIGSTVEPSEP